MKILHLSNCFYNCGGDCTYLFSLRKILENRGHRNIDFSMHYHENVASGFSGYFVSHINYADEMKNITLTSGLKVLRKSLYSFEAKRNVENLVSVEKPDIAHIQSLHHHLTYSVLYPLKKHNIPVVWTLHDYALICPNTTFLNRGKICEKCNKRKYYWPIIDKCKKGSLGASMIAAIEIVLHRIMKIHELVDIFIAPSEFLRNKLIEYGFNENKIICLNNFIDVDPGMKSENMSDYYLYVGRLEREKGVRSLIDAAIKSNTGKLRIVGDGTLREELISYVRSRNKEGDITFLGYRSREEVIELVKNCRFVVLPSEWYENYPFAVLEAFACGKTVIGSKIGGIPELVKDKITGLTFAPGNSDELSCRIQYLMDNPDIAGKMGNNARTYVERELNSERHYERLMEIYRKVIALNYKN